MSSNRKYKFSWDLLRDIEAGRHNLGNTTRLEVSHGARYSLNSREMKPEH